MGNIAEDRSPPVALVAGVDATWRSATGHVGDPGDVEQRGDKGSGEEGGERPGGWRDSSVEANEWNGESAEANEWQGESVVVYKTRSGSDPK